MECTSTVQQKVEVYLIFHFGQLLCFILLIKTKLSIWSMVQIIYFVFFKLKFA